ncbi:MAG TPA: ATP-dependent Clp protease adaptor ClpS [Bacteroidia bacterium]|jgi:ATP-dependent Clp protease adaptor protein ClpS|nr:ATP-dependent Clp protease adaptor ClpS [Bacteroidia bacterium]
METWNYNKEEHHIGTESELVLDPEDLDVGDRQIILYNDDVNTFDFVITTLIKVCKHDPIQAEQCTYLVHYKGKCSVKKGTYEDLEPMCTSLLERGLTAEII